MKPEVLIHIAGEVGFKIVPDHGRPDMAVLKASTRLVAAILEKACDLVPEKTIKGSAYWLAFYPRGALLEALPKLVAMVLAAREGAEINMAAPGGAQ